MSKGGKTRRGFVIKTHNRFYLVQVDSDQLLCSPKGHLKQEKNPEYRLPVAGDEVTVEHKAGERPGVDGYITRIHQRKNSLSRNVGDGPGRKNRVMAANLDQIFIVSAVQKPGLDWHLTDRYLVACALAKIEAKLVLNKIDLDPSALQDPMLAAYRDAGYEIIPASAKQSGGMAELERVIHSGISLFTGNSGVGKSSLINRLIPKANLATGEVDARKGQGKHTTTFSVLTPLDGGGYLVDSPGLRDFLPPAVPPDEVRFGFREIAHAQADCKFGSCLHISEPKCAVKEAVDQGGISSVRYKSYCFILAEMQRLWANQY